MGDTQSGSWTSRELGQHIADEKAAAARREAHRVLVYDELTRHFNGFANQIGGWPSENGVYLDGKLWALALKIAVGEFELANKTTLLSPGQE